MKVIVGVNPVWVNTMPQIALPGIDETEKRSTGIPLVFRTAEVLPKGGYQVEVTLTGPDGQKYTAAADFEVRHAS